jgi:hypothetical protein
MKPGDNIFMATYPKRLPETRCPHCQAVVSAATIVNQNGDRRAPVPGDPSICGYCAELNVFGVMMELCKPTEHQLARFQERAAFWDMLQTLQRHTRAMVQDKRRRQNV